MLIGGRWLAAADDRWIESLNPADETPTGRVPAATASDVGAAVQAAQAAQRDWANCSVWERAAMLRALAAGDRKSTRLNSSHRH